MAKSPEEMLAAAGAETTRVVAKVVRLVGDTDRDETGSWPEPVDIMGDAEAMGPPVLKREHIPEALYDFATDTAGRMGVDPAAVALSAIVCCASVATDDWKIQPKEKDYTWTESPRLWAAIVGDPSILKTPVLQACTKPIEHLEMDAHDAFTAEMIAHNRQQREWNKADKKGEAEGDPPKAPRQSRYMVEGTTIEALSEVLRTDEKARFNTPAKKVLVRQDEMSEWLGSMDRYRNGGGNGGADRGAYLRLYNGGRHQIDRVMRGSFTIPNWSACFLGGIQPGPIQKIASNSEEDGLLQRFIYVVPGYQEAGLDREPDRRAQNRYEGVIKALTALTPAMEADGKHPQKVKLSAGAHIHRERIFDLARVLAVMPDTSTRLRAAYGKWPGLYSRILLTFHLIEMADARARGQQTAHHFVVGAETAARATAFMEAIILPHLQRADSLMFASQQTGHVNWIAGFILSEGKPRVAARDIGRAYRTLGKPEDRRTLLGVMSTLEVFGWVTPVDPGNPTKDVTSWNVNPKVLVIFAERAKAERDRRKAIVERLRKLLGKKL